MDLKQRLERYVVKQPKSNGCWLWIGTHDENDRPTVRLDAQGGRQLALPLLLAASGVENIKFYHLLERTCDNPYCVNPQHHVHKTWIQALIDRVKFEK